MQCKDVESVVEQEGLAPLPKEVNTHLAQCRECRNYIADLTSIVDVARKMPSEIAPPDRAGLLLIRAVRVYDDGRAYAYGYRRLLSDLYLVEGLK